jgi:hypothetical protein
VPGEAGEYPSRERGIARRRRQGPRFRGTVRRPRSAGRPRKPPCASRTLNRSGCGRRELPQSRRPNPALKLASISTRTRTLSAECLQSGLGRPDRVYHAARDRWLGPAGRTAAGRRHASRTWKPLQHAHGAQFRATTCHSRFDRWSFAGGSAAPPSGRTRPVCAYPQTAIYNGRGSVNDAASFHCGGNVEKRAIVCADVLVKYKHEKDGELSFQGSGVDAESCRRRDDDRWDPDH